MNLEIVNDEIKIKKSKQISWFCGQAFACFFRNHKSKITRDKFLKLILQNQKTDFLKFEIRNPESEIGNRKLEIGNWKLEIGNQKSEIRNPITGRRAP